jgi:hypothetical protein
METLMKHVIASALILLSPALVMAQTADKPVARTAAKAPAQPKAPQTSSRQQLKTATNQVAAGIRAAEAALTPAELAVAERVHVGQLPCELGATVNLESDARVPGYFNLHGKGFQYRMAPVETTTGAIRLEDKHAGAVWLQLANKSMLMDQKQGKRLADECASPEQVAVAQAMKTNPPPSLIDTSTLRK